MHRLQNSLKSQDHDLHQLGFIRHGRQGVIVMSRMILKELSQVLRRVCFKLLLDVVPLYYNSPQTDWRDSNQTTLAGRLQSRYKTAMLMLPVVELVENGCIHRYTKMVTMTLNRIKTLIKLVGTPGATRLIDVLCVQWRGGSGLDSQTVLNLKGLNRSNKQAVMLEQIGLYPLTALCGAKAGGVASEDLVAERMKGIRERTIDAAAKEVKDLCQLSQTFTRISV